MEGGRSVIKSHLVRGRASEEASKQPNTMINPGSVMPLCSCGMLLPAPTFSRSRMSRGNCQLRTYYLHGGRASDQPRSLHSTHPL